MTGFEPPDALLEKLIDAGIVHDHGCGEGNATNEVGARECAGPDAEQESHGDMPRSNHQ
jgi:hypothetical protein